MRQREKGIIKNTFPFSPSHITKRKGNLDFYHTMITIMFTMTITTCTEVPSVTKKKEKRYIMSMNNVHTFFFYPQCAAVGNELN